MMTDSYMLSIAVGAFVTLCIPMGGWLINRAIKSFDSNLLTMHADIKSLSTIITNLSESTVELRVRVANVEREQAHLAQLYSDMGGFLHSQGFRKRDPS